MIDGERPAWHTQALCRGQLNLFFPVGSEPDIAELRPICDACPVRLDCLEFALATGEQGVWGGTTEYERRRHHRQLRAAGTANNIKPPPGSDPGTRLKEHHDRNT